MRMQIAILLSALIITSCGRKNMYTNDLSVPDLVADNYIKAILNGDTNQAMYYIAGNWKEVKDLGVFGGLLEGKSKMKTKYRMIEHFSWKIEKEKSDEKTIIYLVGINHPNEKYVSERMDELLGNRYENGVYISGTHMTESEANTIIRHEKNLPMQTDKFTIQMKKNQYGWVVDGLDKGTEELTTFLNNS